MDTSLSWNELYVQFPSEYCQIDSVGVIHCVANSQTSFTHYMSNDGAVNWTNYTYELEMLQRKSKRNFKQMVNWIYLYQMFAIKVLKAPTSILIPC